MTTFEPLEVGGRWYLPHLDCGVHDGNLNQISVHVLVEGVNNNKDENQKVRLLSMLQLYAKKRNNRLNLARENPH